MPTTARTDAARRTRGATRHGVGAGRRGDGSGPGRGASWLLDGHATKSPTGSSRRSSTPADTRSKSTGSSRSSRTAARFSWQEAMEEFRDATRRPGPAGWQLGTYPEAADDLPVGGVSWYEAAAYAEFAGKSLPTVYEWFAAAGVGRRHLRHSPVEQLRRPGTGSRGKPSRNGPLRKLRHGRQREGMGRERPRRPALPARRLLGRAGIRVQPLRCQTALLARAHGWIPPGPARDSSARRRRSGR